MYIFCLGYNLKYFLKIIILNITLEFDKPETLLTWPNFCWLKILPSSIIDHDNFRAEIAITDLHVLKINVFSSYIFHIFRIENIHNFFLIFYNEIVIIQ